ncbi:MAG: vWA domain-containing protein, partial [Polyangiales bacterium]
IDGSPVQSRVMVGDDGETFGGVWIEAPDEAPQVVERAPMAVSLVVDTSGSMSGEKIRNARMAASSLLENLHDGDVVSIYGFSDHVHEIAAPTSLSPGTRGSLIRRIQGLRAGGGTNMHGGLSTGIARMQHAPRSHEVRRVVLISDGHANIGPSDPPSLGSLAANGTEWGAQITSIGVGLDYDEQTLGALALNSSGRLYHLEAPHQMAQILEEELHLLAQTVATDAYIEVVPAPGVRILEGTTMGSEVENGRLRVNLGSVHAGQRREVLFRAKVDTDRPGGRQLARARLVYKTQNEGERQVQQRPLRYEVTRDRSEASGSVQPRVQAMVSNYNASQAQLRAAEALNQGNRAQADADLEEAERELDRATSYDFGDDAVQGQLEKRRDRVRQIRGRAGSAASPSDARGAALEANDAAFEAQGY